MLDNVHHTYDVWGVGRGQFLNEIRAKHTCLFKYEDDLKIKNNHDLAICIIIYIFAIKPSRGFISSLVYSFTIDLAN
jgi:hypothetical protein